jgi:acetoin utilization deacetylase AcuC-like enzyme
MGVTRKAGLVEDPRFREHRGPAGHPERPERLLAVAEALEPHRPALRTIAPRAAEDDELLRIHGRGHLARVADAARRAPTHLDADTFLSPASLEVARLAAGGTVDLARAVVQRKVHAGLAAVRPPGHHAEAGRAMGFCLFNNVAVAARALQADEGVERVLILDWDVHHGNGTQHSFEDDPSVLYFSTHQFPYYPGTGAASEAGSGRGAGATVNVPMPAGCGDAEYVGVFQRVLVPVVRAFAPDVMLVSAGFDAHRDDPLAAMEVSASGFAAMAAIVRTVADECCQGRLLFVLEGGYAASGLREGVDTTVRAALSPDPPALPPGQDASPGTLLGRILAPVVEVHGRRYPGLGAG